MEYIFGSTEMLWYSKGMSLAYIYPANGSQLYYQLSSVAGIHSAGIDLVASFSPLATLIFSALLWVLGVLTISYLVGSEVISRGTVHTRKLAFQPKQWGQSPQRTRALLTNLDQNNWSLHSETYQCKLGIYSVSST